MIYYPILIVMCFGAELMCLVRCKPRPPTRVLQETLGGKTKFQDSVYSDIQNTLDPRVSEKRL